MGVAQGIHAFEVVGDDEDGQARAAPLGQDGDEQVARGRVESRHGFVENKDARVGGEQAGEGDASHLSSGEVVDAARGQGGVESDEFHGLGDDTVARLAADRPLAVRGAGADALRRDAEAIEKAGAFAVVFEMVPAGIATELTASLPIPTIGIGAGPNTDGQVLVWSDMAGYSDWTPSFVRKFGQLGAALREAASDYVEAVRERSFPGPDNYKND